MADKEKAEEKVQEGSCSDSESSMGDEDVVIDSDFSEDDGDSDDGEVEDEVDGEHRGDQWPEVKPIQRRWKEDDSLRQNVMNPYECPREMAKIRAETKSSPPNADMGNPWSASYLTWNLPTLRSNSKAGYHKFIQNSKCLVEEHQDKDSITNASVGAGDRCGMTASLLSFKRKAEVEEAEEGMACQRKKGKNVSLWEWLCFKPPGQAATAATRAPESFKLTDHCKLVLQGGDITRWHKDGESDAIVNAANEAMLGGAGVDGAIHLAAGKELLEACEALPEARPGVRCPVGHAVETPAFKLPVRRIIHTVGPKYFKPDAAALLRSAYRSSLDLAKVKGVRYIAFPAISCGVYGYPAVEAAEIALDTVQRNADGFDEIHFVLFDKKVRDVWYNAAEQRLETITDAVKE